MRTEVHRKAPDINLPAGAGLPKSTPGSVPYAGHPACSGEWVWQLNQEGNLSTYLSNSRHTRRLRIAAGSAVVLSLVLSGLALATSVPTDPDPDLACPEASGTGAVTRYVTTVNTPADSTDWWVNVEFTIADMGDEAAACELSLATYELAGPTFSFPQTLHDGATGVFGAGTHTLTAQLPTEGEAEGCFGQYDFVFGPLITNLTFEDRYGDRQIRSRIVGSEACPSTEQPPQQPTPTPEGETEGNTSLPNTSMSAGGNSAVATIAFGILLMTSLASVGLFNVRAVRARRAR